MQNDSLITDDVASESASDDTFRLTSTGRFKLALSLPGKDIVGKWLSRTEGDALAYKYYCIAGSSPLIFTSWINSKGALRLQDQDGYWLSWEITANCLYTSYQINAGEWKLEGKRLIRFHDGAVVSRPADQHWPLATAHFLMALPEGEWALDVKVVEEPAVAVAA